MDYVYFNRQTCIDAFTTELFATDAVLKLTREGTPFRDAYQQIAKDPFTSSETDPVANISSKKHLGATGNLGIDLSYLRLKDYQAWIDTERHHWADTLANLERNF